MPLIKHVNELDQLITIQSISSGGDSGPEPNATEYNDLFKTWAHIRTTNLNEALIDGAYTFPKTVTFVIRHDQPAAINTTMQLVWKDDTYSIKEINPDDSYREWDIIIAELYK